jgi:hypothetical protein
MGIYAKTYCKKKRLIQESSPKSSPKSSPESSPNLVQSSVYNMPIILSDLSTDNNTISLGFQRQRPQIARILVFSNTLTFVSTISYAESNNDIFYKYKVGQTANA